MLRVAGYEYKAKIAACLHLCEQKIGCLWSLLRTYIIKYIILARV